MKKISGKLDAQEAIIYTLNMQEAAKYRICQFQSSSHGLSEGLVDQVNLTHTWSISCAFKLTKNPQ